MLETKSKRPGHFIPPTRRKLPVIPSSPNSPPPPALFPLPSHGQNTARSTSNDVIVKQVLPATSTPAAASDPQNGEETDVEDEDEEDRQASQALNSTWPAINPDNQDMQDTGAFSRHASLVDSPAPNETSSNPVDGNNETFHNFNPLTQKTPDDYMGHTRADEEDSLTSLSSLSIDDSPTPGAQRAIKRKRILKKKTNPADQDESASEDDSSFSSHSKSSKRKKLIKTSSPDHGNAANADADDDGDEEEEEDEEEDVDGLDEENTQNGGYKISNRRFFGKHTFNITCLKQPLGKVSAIGNQRCLWPKKGKDTVKGRLRSAATRVHWACAGLEAHDNYDDDEWQCPPCQALKETQDVHEVGSIYCIRPDCILRAHKSVAVTDKDKELWLLRSIIGYGNLTFKHCQDLGIKLSVRTKVIGRKNDGRKEFMYLVAWVEWENCDATWEPAENIDHLDGHFTTFLAKAEEEGIDFDAQTVVLLKEAQKDWDGDGKLKTGRSAKWEKHGWDTTRSGQLLA